MRRILTVTSLVVALALLIVAVVPGVAEAAKPVRAVTLNATATYNASSGNCNLSGSLAWSNWGAWGVYTEWYNVTDGQYVPDSAKTFWFARRAKKNFIPPQNMTDMPPGTYRFYGYLMKPNGRPVKDSSTWSTTDYVCGQ
jgi:hypothetical protein